MTVRENVMVRVTMTLRTASLLAMLAMYNMIQVRDIKPRWPSCWSSSHPDASYQISSQLAFLFRRRSEKYIFKWWSWHDGGHLWFPIRTILTIFFVLQFHPDTPYQVSGQLAEGWRQSFWRLFQNKLLMTRNGHWLTTVAYTDHWSAKTRMYEGWSKIIAHCVIAGYRRATWNKSMHTCIALFNTYTINLTER